MLEHITLVAKLRLMATQTNKTAYFHGTISDQEVGAIRAGNYYRFKAPVLTMRAR